MDFIDILVIISMAIFYIIFFGRIILLYKKGIKVSMIGLGRKKLYVKILESASTVLSSLCFIFVIYVALHIDQSEIIVKYYLKINWIKYFGIILCYIGLLIFLLALISFGKVWRIGIDENNSNKLITSGIFKYSRNPIYLFMDIYFVGILLIYTNIVFIVIAIGILIGIHIQILREERFLTRKFGEKYREYKSMTRRYI